MRVSRERLALFWMQISILLLQVRGALSGEWEGCFCQWELKAPTDRSRSDCVHEQVAKLGPASRAEGMDCECPLYRRPRNGLQISVLLQNKHFSDLSVRGTLSGGEKDAFLRRAFCYAREIWNVLAERDRWKDKWNGRKKINWQMILKDNETQKNALKLE